MREQELLPNQRYPTVMGISIKTLLKLSLLENIGYFWLKTAKVRGLCTKFAPQTGIYILPGIYKGFKICLQMPNGND